MKAISVRSRIILLVSLTIASYIQAQSWQPRADAPLGSSGLPFATGSAFCNSDSVCYCLKGSSAQGNEFYRYDPANNNWAPLETLRAVGRSGTPVPAGSGACLAFAFGPYPAGKVYCAKGNNSFEFWHYAPTGRPDAYPWVQRADIPTGAGPITAGASITSVLIGTTPYIYLLKGSGTTEFYRYAIASDEWQTMASAPLGPSGRPFGPGSCIAYDGQRTIYALKGNGTNEFYGYRVDSNYWFTVADLPLGSSGSPADEGASLICRQRQLFALKGNATAEFYKYDADSNRWTACPDLPAGSSGRLAGPGTSLAYYWISDQIYCLKANGTTEFYCYLLQPGVAEQSSSSIKSRELKVAPNPGAGSFRFIRSTEEPLPIRIQDITGRLIDILPAGSEPVWNGCDALGRPVPPGVYIVTLSGKDASEHATLLKLE